MTTSGDGYRLVLQFTSPKPITIRLTRKPWLSATKGWPKTRMRTQDYPYDPMYTSFRRVTSALANTGDIRVDGLLCAVPIATVSQGLPLECSGNHHLEERGRVMGFQQVDLGDGVVVMFEVSDAGSAGLDAEGRGLEQLEKLAVGADKLTRAFRDRLAPDEVGLEVSVGMSAEVGWFFAKSEAEATITLSLAWTKEPAS